MNSPKQQLLFGTPLFQFPAYLPSKVNDKLKEALLKMKSDGETGGVKSNVGGWHSKSLEGKDDLCFQILNQYINLCFLKVVGEANKDKWNKSSWAIINRNNDYNMPHSHANSDWSCVYYVDSGYNSKDSKDKFGRFNGNLVFIDPRGSLIENSRTIAGQDALYDKMFGHAYVSLTPKTGLLVFFPSWLIHSVTPYKGNTPRIIISANYYLIK